ncbi:glutathione S-transferase family protein [Pseudorhodoplanes sp.]|uniref:glutathione S-transferase family protein n=1 Tax=Pseudorhodoplanes sp. TaxID=1934341 RepID=UPI002B99B164|nr:glutathione S-transferase family protein [Pseudorhodoplanes sp.]HWV51926.1 glutathione S-transferase family protein [Pseudorhodoplanes sp.]
MILRSAPPSPFGRKVKIAAGLLGLSDRITIVAADTNDASDDLRTQNPLGKIPTLVLDDGQTLFDSRVILDYLDHIAGGGRIIPREPNARFAALRMQALCDGILDASILRVYEARYRPQAIHHQPWLDYQADKVVRALAVLEAEPQALDPVPHVGQITLACALGYQDLRFAGTWRANHPQLVAWLDRFAAQVPAFDQTRVAT